MVLAIIWEPQGRYLIIIRIIITIPDTYTRCRWNVCSGTYWMTTCSIGVRNICLLGLPRSRRALSSPHCPRAPVGMFSDAIIFSSSSPGVKVMLDCHPFFTGLGDVARVIVSHETTSVHLLQVLLHQETCHLLFCTRTSSYE